MNVFVLFTLAAVVLSFAMMVFAILHRSQDNSLYLIFLFGACFMYSFGYLLEITSTQLDAAFFGVRVSYIGLPSILPFTYLYLRDVYGEKRLSFSRHLALFFIPLISSLSVQLYPLVKLYYVGAEYIFNGWMANCRVYPGILNHLGFIYTYFLVLLCILKIVKNVKKSKHSRKQSIVYILALLFPVGTTIPYVAGAGLAVRYDFTPLALSLTMGLLMYSLFFTNFLLVLPVAREQVLEDMKDAFVVCSGRNQFLYTNPAGVFLFPHLARLKPGDPLLDFPILDESSNEVSLQVQGQTRVYTVSQTPVQPQSQKSATCFMFHDITQKVNMLSSLRARAIYDELTGIYNRDSFAALHSKHCEDPDCFCALMLVDVDNFKAVNDRCGHLAGDQVLRQIVTHLQDNLQKDESIGRFGGEEILLMKTGQTALNTEDIIGRAQSLRLLIQDSVFQAGAFEAAVTISIGIGISRLGQAKGFDALLDVADKALYEAKQDGKNKVVLFDDPPA